ncbi:hypothetical protein KR038_008628, partial [Drosophila bunnanda]
ISGMYQIEKLDEKNYDSSCVQVRSVLEHAELWTIATGELKEKAAEDGVDWTGLDQKALTIIIPSVKLSQLGYAKHSGHA